VGVSNLEIDSFTVVGCS